MVGRLIAAAGLLILAGVCSWQTYARSPVPIAMRRGGRLAPGLATSPSGRFRLELRRGTFETFDLLLRERDGDAWRAASDEAQALRFAPAPGAVVVGDGGRAAVFTSRLLLMYRSDGNLLRLPRRDETLELLASPRIEATGQLVALLTHDAPGRVTEWRFDIDRRGARLRERVLLARDGAPWAAASLVALWLVACLLLWERRSPVNAMVAVGALASLLGVLSLWVAWEV